MKNLFRGFCVFGYANGGKQIDLRNGKAEKLLSIVDEYSFAFSNGKFGLFWKCKNLNSTTENQIETFLEDNNIRVDFHQYVADVYSIDETINLK